MVASRERTDGKPLHLVLKLFLKGAPLRLKAWSSKSLPGLHCWTPKTNSLFRNFPKCDWLRRLLSVRWAISNLRKIKDSSYIPLIDIILPCIDAELQAEFKQVTQTAASTPGWNPCSLRRRSPAWSCGNLLFFHCFGKNLRRGRYMVSTWEVQK